MREPDSACASLTITPVKAWRVVTALEDSQARFHGNAALVKSNGVKLHVELKSSGLFWGLSDFWLFMISWIIQQVSLTIQ